MKACCGCHKSGTPLGVRGDAGKKSWILCGKNSNAGARRRVSASNTRPQDARGKLCFHLARGKAALQMHTALSIVPLSTWENIWGDRNLDVSTRLCCKRDVCKLQIILVALKDGGQSIRLPRAARVPFQQHYPDRVEGMLRLLYPSRPRVVHVQQDSQSEADLRSTSLDSSPDATWLGGSQHCPQG